MKAWVVESAGDYDCWKIRVWKGMNVQSCRRGRVERCRRERVWVWKGTRLNTWAKTWDGERVHGRAVGRAKRWEPGNSRS